MKRILKEDLGNCFQIRVNENFTPEDCHRIIPEKYKICQVVYPVDQSKIIELNENKYFIKNQDLVILDWLMG